MLAPARIDTASGLKIDVAFYPMPKWAEISVSVPPRRQCMRVGVVWKSAQGAHAPTGRYKALDSDTPGEPLLLNGMLRKIRVPCIATCECSTLSISRLL